MGIRVIAIEAGHDGLALRQQGEVFEVSKEWLDKKYSWVRPAKKGEDSNPDPDTPVPNGSPDLVG